MECLWKADIKIIHLTLFSRKFIPRVLQSIRQTKTTVEAFNHCFHQILVIKETPKEGQLLTKASVMKFIGIHFK